MDTPLPFPKLEPFQEPSIPSSSSSSPHSTTITQNHRQGGDLVRVINHLSLADEVYFREVFRKTRMVYNSFWVFASFMKTTTRPDLAVGKTMRDRGLWLNHDKCVMGSIPGIKVGDIFLYREELCAVGLHGKQKARIDYVPISQSPSGEIIATCVVVGEFGDDLDSGDEIVYTGQGGNNKDQELEGGNLALERSMHYGIEVRVVRGLKYEGSVSGKVYVYEGLYRVLGFGFDVGSSGFRVYKFKLARIGNQPEMGSVILRYAASLRSKILSEMPNGYITLDISKGKEKVPIMLFNDVDDNKEPLNYGYTETAIFPAFVYSGGNVIGCDCLNECNSEKCHCASKNGGKFAYDENGFLVRGKPLVFECGVNCSCSSSCQNRVSQHGIKYRFEIFRSKETDWGVRSLDLIQAGSFICEYAGVAFTKKQAETLSMNGDYKLVYPSRFSERWAEWGDLSWVFTDYVRPNHPSMPQLDFALETSKERNFACYISHSSSPNAFIQYVFYEHNNRRFPHLMVFAMENIAPLSEITIDHGVADEGSGRSRNRHS